MRILDRTIIGRFLWNFFVLFTLLFIFASSIDVILQMDKYLRAASYLVENGTYKYRAVAFVAMIFSSTGRAPFNSSNSWLVCSAWAPWGSLSRRCIARENSWRSWPLVFRCGAACGRCWQHRWH